MVAHSCLSWLLRHLFTSSKIFGSFNRFAVSKPNPIVYAQAVNGYLYTAAATIVGLLGLAIATLATMILSFAIDPAIDSSSYWFMLAILLGISGLIFWPISWLLRRLRASSWGQGETADDARKRRFSRWRSLAVTGALFLAFGGWYLESASSSHYVIPTLEDALTMKGTLKKPAGRSKYRAIVIDSAEGRMVFGCSPNNKWASYCLPSAEHKKLAGQPVIISYFVYPDAKRYGNVLLELRTTDGKRLVSYAKSRENLLKTKAIESKQDWRSTIPFSLWVTCFMWLLWQINGAAQDYGRRIKARQTN